jgi:hypothetical protein
VIIRAIDLKPGHRLVAPLQISPSTVKFVEPLGEPVQTVVVFIDGGPDGLEKFHCPPEFKLVIELPTIDLPQAEEPARFPWDEPL